jgi:glutamate/tyrosine decarboxylase-like PLP-dependent enzyme
VDLFGLGLDSLRSIPCDGQQRMRPDALVTEIRRDLDRGNVPFLAVGSAGTVSTGAIDPLPEIARICREYDLWFHVAGAYGAPAAALPEAPSDLKALSEADSVAVDPHKWLYAPLEAGCVLVRDASRLRDTFSFHPVYYNFAKPEGEETLDYHEYGPQNSRGFRALKVWLGLRQAGREGHAHMIREDIALAKLLYDRAAEAPDLEPLTCNLSITTFRYVPADLRGDPTAEPYLHELNNEILHRIQRGGEAFVSNAVIDGKFALRACVVNFRTTRSDIEAFPALVVKIGRLVHAERLAAQASEPTLTP